MYMYQHSDKDVKMVWLARAQPYSLVLSTELNCNLVIGLYFITIF